MEIKIVEYDGIKRIQVLDVEDTQGVEVLADHYQEIKKLAKELGWEKKTECNFKIHDDTGGDCALMEFKFPGEDISRHFKCKGENCILQQQLKLLKEIKEKLKIKNNPKCMCGDYKDEHLRSGTACSKCSCREFVERR